MERCGSWREESADGTYESSLQAVKALLTFTVSFLERDPVKHS